MSYSFPSATSKVELGSHPDDDDYTDQEYPSSYHKECRGNTKQMPYVIIPEEDGKSVFELRNELNDLLFFRDSEEPTSIEEKRAWNSAMSLVKMRITHLKTLLF